MPFTPYHMGPGMLVKALLRGAFSLMIFGLAQVFIDLQPLYAMLTGSGPTHGITHSIVGAAVIAVPAAVLGTYGVDFLLRTVPRRSTHALTVSWPVAISSALIGTYSHVLIDCILYADAHPLWPLSDANPLLHIVPNATVEMFYVGSGILGLAIYLGTDAVIWLRGRTAHTH